MLRLLTRVVFQRAYGHGSRLYVKVSKPVYDAMMLSDAMAWPWCSSSGPCGQHHIEGKEAKDS